MTKTVLIVDDEKAITLSLGHIMTRAGYRVRVASDGAEALAAVAEDRPDLILLDIVLPVRDGYDVCETLRADPANDRTRIVMLTARTGEAARRKAMALGADAYLTKPFARDELLALAATLLGVEAEDAPPAREMPPVTAGAAGAVALHG